MYIVQVLLLPSSSTRRTCIFSIRILVVGVEQSRQESGRDFQRSFPKHLFARLGIFQRRRTLLYEILDQCAFGSLFSQIHQGLHKIAIGLSVHFGQVDVTKVRLSSQGTLKAKCGSFVNIEKAIGPGLLGRIGRPCAAGWLGQ